MSKSDGWDKHKNGYEWHKRGETFVAEVARVTGGAFPYYWTVHPLPRPKGEMWKRISGGSSRTLAIAKSEAQSAIDAYVVAE